MSPSPNSPLFPSSPAPDGEYELPPIDETGEPIRQRKPSRVESAKPKVAFPVTDPTEAYATEPTSPQPPGNAPAPRPSQIPVPTASSSQPTRTRVVSTTSRGGSVPPPSAAGAAPTTSATPSRSRTTSQHRTSSSAAAKAEHHPRSAISVQTRGRRPSAPLYWPYEIIFQVVDISYAFEIVYDRASYSQQASDTVKVE